MLSLLLFCQLGGVVKKNEMNGKLCYSFLLRLLRSEIALTLPLSPSKQGIGEHRVRVTQLEAQEDQPTTRGGCCRVRLAVYFFG